LHGDYRTLHISVPVRLLTLTITLSILVCVTLIPVPLKSMSKGFSYCQNLMIYPTLLLAVILVASITERRVLYQLYNGYMHLCMAAVAFAALAQMVLQPLGFAGASLASKRTCLHCTSYHEALNGAALPSLIFQLTRAKSRPAWLRPTWWARALSRAGYGSVPASM